MYGVLLITDSDWFKLNYPYWDASMEISYNPIGIVSTFKQNLINKKKQQRRQQLCLNPKQVTRI